ncbi:Uncharacterised protein [Granulicatella adiacens]|nr:Uncharacterised protein [Granulicatella adiacens]
MSTLIGVTEDKTEVFFASLPHLKEEYFHQLVDGFFREGIVSENESGLVLLREIPDFPLVTNGSHSVNYLMHPYSFVQLRDVIRLWVEWISYNRYKETSYRPLIQNVWLQQLFKRWYKEKKENITSVWFSSVVDEFKVWSEKQEESVKGHWVGLFNGAKSTAALENELVSLWGFTTVEDCEPLSRLVLMKWVSDVFEEPENSPITYGWFSKMFEWISHETSSVQETVRLFCKGMKRSEIAHLRKLKESTINDHLLKYVLLSKEALYERVEETKAALAYKSLFENGQYPRYKEAKDQFESEGKKLDFFLFRYYQIKALKERERHGSNIESIRI